VVIAAALRNCYIASIAHYFRQQALVA